MIKDIDILKSLTVLYAEDDIVIQESVSRILNIFFKEVYITNDGNEALKIYKSNKPNIIILDYVMPNLDGYQVARIIREIDRKIPIVIVSAYTDKEKLLNAIELNLVKYLEKPILYNNLITTFEDIINYLKQNNLIEIKLDENSFYSFSKKVVIKNNQEIVLTKNEILFLELLLDKPNQLILKEVIGNVVFRESVDENTLRNMVYRFRKKIDSDVIVTIKDLGYLIKI